MGAQRSLTQCLLDLRDIGSSVVWFLSMQTWSTMWSLLINIVSVVFYNYYRTKGLAAQIDLVLIEMVVVLPMVGFIWMLQQRRDKCLDLMTDVKTGFLFLTRRMVDEIRQLIESLGEEATEKEQLESRMLMEKTRMSISKVRCGRKPRRALLLSHLHSHRRDTPPPPPADYHRNARIFPTEQVLLHAVPILGV